MNLVLKEMVVDIPIDFSLLSGNKSLNDLRLGFIEGIEANKIVVFLRLIEIKFQIGDCLPENQTQCSLLFLLKPLAQRFV